MQVHVGLRVLRKICVSRLKREGNKSNNSQTRYVLYTADTCAHDLEYMHGVLNNGHVADD